MTTTMTTMTPTSPSKSTLSVNTYVSPSHLHHPATSTPLDTATTPTVMGHSQSNNIHNSNESLLLLSLETMNEELRNLLSQEHVQLLLLKVQERSSRLEQYTQQQQQQIQTTLQYLIQVQQEQQNHALLQNQEQPDRTEVNNHPSVVTPDVVSSSPPPLQVTLPQHQIRRRTLVQHTATSLLELLELPNLMDACIKSSSSTTTSRTVETTTNHENNNHYYYYDEAIQIAAFANTLERRHGSSQNPNHNSGGGGGNNSSSSIIHQVMTQIRWRQDELRQHLILRLQQQPLGGSSSNPTPTTTTTTLMMNECLEIITALRRLNAIDLERMTTTTTPPSMEQAHAIREYQLQICFLEARDVWLDHRPHQNNHHHHRSSSSTGSSGSGGNNGQITSSETILDLMERYRTRMFEIATQYNAIFTTSSSSSSTTASAQQLLSLWMARRIQVFLQLLRRELTFLLSTNHNHNVGAHSAPNQTPTIDTAMVRDAIEASVFFATSLGRLGGDFSSQLVSIFEPVVIQIITQYWNDGRQQFHQTLEICRDAGMAGPLSTLAFDGNGDGDNDNDTDHSNKYDESPSTSVPPLDEPQPPPKRLLTLPPLARFVNAILTGLNELRRCLLPGTFMALRQAMKRDVIDAMTQELDLNERMVVTPGLRGDAAALRSIAVRMKETFRVIVTPFLLGSLEAAIGYKNGAIQYHTQLYANLQKLQQPPPNAASEEVDREIDEEPEDITTTTTDENGLRVDEIRGNVIHDDDDDDDDEMNNRDALDEDNDDVDHSTDVP